jgi:hypothetical protein
MSTASRVTSCLTLAFIAGCASHPSEFAIPDPPVSSAARATAKLPDRTPFDADPAMRAVYQNYYWLGYAEARMGGASSFCDNGHPWYEVQFRGFSDGQRDGLTWRRPATTRASK